MNHVQSESTVVQRRRSLAMLEPAAMIELVVLKGKIRHSPKCSRKKKFLRRYPIGRHALAAVFVNYSQLSQTVENVRDNL